MIVRHRLGTEQVGIVTASGATVAVHAALRTAAGATVRDDRHVRAPETKVRACSLTLGPVR